MDLSQSTIQIACQTLTSLENEKNDMIFQRMAHFDTTPKITLTWHNINVFVKTKKSPFSCFKSQYDINEQKQLLHNVSGVARPGQLLAIMGASGAGKSTLLNVLTKRNIRLLNVDGKVLARGQKVGASIVKLSAYVQQDDLFIGTLKVKEHLIFQALLRMDQNISYRDRIKRVEEVILELGLSKCSDTMIGVAGRIKGISGGEAKRLAFASEVLTNPSLMFCDEPTSGLDSFMAQNVVSVLREMAKGGRTIVCTIHQPSSETFELFDDLLLLAEGRVAFMGKSSDALAFFERAGLRCPINYNPSDFYINHLAVKPGAEAASREKISAICNQFAKESSTFENDISAENSFTDAKMQQNSKYKASWYSQFKAVLWRSWICTIREPMSTRIRFLQGLTLGIFFGLVYFNQSLDQKGIMNINGAIFIMLVNLTISNMMNVVNVFMEEQFVFLREHWNGMYRADVYFLSKTIAEMPIVIVVTLAFVTIPYWMIGLNSDYTAFLYYLYIMILLANASASFGYLVSCMSRSLNVALSIAVPMVLPMVLFGGFYLNAGSVPVYFIWIKYISWIYYGNEALAINQWRDVMNITCSTLRCTQNGKEVLDTLNFEEDNFFRNIALIVVMMVFFRSLAFIALLIKSRRKS